MKGRIWRKATAASLALLIVSGYAPVRPAADLFMDMAITARAMELEKSGSCGESANWSFDESTGKLTISGEGAMADFQVDLFDDKITVPWYAYSGAIKSVEIGNGITSIGNYAFADCITITSVTIPAGVTSIGERAFCGCKSLTSIDIPGSVTSIGSYAFESCIGLESITIPAGVTSIGKYAFRGCNSLTSIDIPGGVISVGEGAFSICTRLESITIPNSVTTIYPDAFDFCTSLTDIYWYTPASVLESVRLPNHNLPNQNITLHVPVKYAAQYNDISIDGNVKLDVIPASGLCGGQATWTLDLKTGKLTISGEGAMDDVTSNEQTGINLPWDIYTEDIKTVEIADGITTIGDTAFYGCSALTSVQIPSSVKRIGKSAFGICTSLASVTISKGVTTIADYAFDHCSNLSSITIPDSVTSIGVGAFSDCTSLTSVTIPKSVTSIGGTAFFNCENLAAVTIPESVTSIGPDVVQACTNLTDIYCNANPDNLTWKSLPEQIAIHVPAAYLAGYKDKYGKNVTFVGNMGLGEHLYGYSISLDGSIGVNFYVELTDDLLESGTAKMVFTVPNGSETETQTLLVNDVIADDSNKAMIGGKTYYKFKCSISAKDMASPITAQMSDGEKTGSPCTYSVREYANYLLSHTEVEEYEEAAPLVKAMLNYGAYAQKYFGIDGTLANEGFENPSVDDVDADTINKPYDSEFTFLDGAGDTTFEGATLSLKSETTLSLYFKSSTDLSFDIIRDGIRCEVEKDTTADGYQIARIRGIQAADLDETFSLNIYDADKPESYGYIFGHVAYCPLTYCYNVLNGGSADENLKNVCRALYLYEVEANRYFG